MSIPKRGTWSMPLVVLVLSATLGAGVAFAATQNDLGGSGVQAPAGTTPDGRSFGGFPDSEDAAFEDLPELVAVVGDHGIKGYADKRPLFGEGAEPPSPDSKEWDDYVIENAKPIVVPVFASDGVTKVDTFTIGDVDVPGGKKQWRIEDGRPEGGD